MAKQKFYAVKTGRTPGIYFNWSDCKQQVDGFPDAKYKSFSSVTDACSYIEGPESPEDNMPQTLADAAAPDVPSGPYAFVDGSFNENNGMYGYGGFLDVNGHRYPVMGSGSDPELSAMRNVAGEIAGSMAAVTKAEELGLRELTVLYDYKGIEEWATGGWKTNNPATKAYKEFMDPSNRKVDVVFEKVAAHTGIEGNEMADVMAKSAVGIPLTRSQQQLFERAMATGSREGILDIPEEVGVSDEQELET